MSVPLLVNRERRNAGSPGSSPRTRATIRRGAAAAFARWGYKQTSVERILEKARVTRRTFYRYYRSKDDVFADLLDELVDALCAPAAGRPDEERSVHRRIVVRTETTLRVAYEHRRMLRAVAEAIRMNPRHAVKWQRLRQLLDSLHRTSLAWCIRHGMMRPVDPAIVSGLLSGMTESMLLNLGRDDGEERRKLRDALVDLYWNTLFRPYEGAEDYLLGPRGEPSAVFASPEEDERRRGKSFNARSRRGTPGSSRR